MRRDGSRSRDGKGTAGSARACALALGVLCSGAVPLTAQLPLAWRASAFACAVFDEARTVNLRTDVAGVTRDETVRREGRLVLNAAAVAPHADGAVPLEAWYDQLSLTRRSVDGELRPDTDGVLGGRFVGVLSADGRWTSERRPFVPDDLRDVSDVGATLDDLLPRLPGFLLREDGRITDTTGTRFERLADSLVGDRRLVRLLARSTWDRALTLAKGDAGPDAREKGTRESRMVLDGVSGLLRLERHTLTEGAMPKSPQVRGPMRADFDERLLLVRRPELRVDECP